MKSCAMIGLSALLLAACTSVSSEPAGSVTLNGKSYPLETRTINGPSGTFQQTKVFVHNVPYTCQPDSAGNCAAKVRGALNRYDRSGR